MRPPDMVLTSAPHPVLQAAARHRDWQRQQGDGQQAAAADADTAALGGLSPKASGSFKVQLHLCNVCDTTGS
jgi:hypothetical protein